ncbi:MAG: hypothetical protein QOH01_2318 [Verrucomicrobiota bacterium]|jgi:hypothetical protein
MRSPISFVALLIAGMTLFGCVSEQGFSPQSWKFPIDGKVSSISRADLGTAVAAADSKRIYGVHVIDRNHVKVDISDDLHKVGHYDERGRYYIQRIHGDPMYVMVTRRHGKWDQGDGAIVTTY